MALVLTDHLMHRGVEHQPGQPVPAGVDVDRLKRLGLVREQSAVKPAKRRVREKE